MRLNRNTVLVGVVGVAATALLLVSGCAGVPRESRVDAVRSVDSRATWLKKHATAWSGDGPDDAAVDAIVRGIGDARVVMLGELTHGDAKSFAFKTELAKRLHREHGFDVLIWESGLFDCAVMDRELAGSAPIEKVSSTGVFGHWARSSETISLFEYARKSKGSARPLIMAGFDLQESGTASWHRWPTYLEWIGEAPGLDRAVLDQARQAVADASKIRDAADPAAEHQRIVNELRGCAAPIAAWYGARGVVAGEGIDEREYRFRRQCLASEARLSEMMSLFGQGMAEQNDAKMTQAYNLREEVNADNLVWLVEDYFAGKRVLVWAHNVHISACGPAGTEEVGTRVSMGTLVKRRLGDQAYALGVVGYQGKWAWLGNPPIEYAAAHPDSLEMAWGAAGAQSAFLDLRSCRGEGHWLMQPRNGYLDQQAAKPAMVRWPLVYDGVVFFRDMTPRVGIPTGAGK